MFKQVSHPSSHRIDSQSQRENAKNVKPHVIDFIAELRRIRNEISAAGSEVPSVTGEISDVTNEKFAVRNEILSLRNASPRFRNDSPPVKIHFSMNETDCGSIKNEFIRLATEVPRQT